MRTDRVSAMDATATTKKVRENLHPAWAVQHDNQLSSEPNYRAFAPVDGRLSEGPRTQTVARVNIRAALVGNRGRGGFLCGQKGIRTHVMLR